MPSNPDRSTLYYTDGNYESQCIELQNGTNTITDVLYQQYALLDCCDSDYKSIDRITNVSSDIRIISLYSIGSWAPNPIMISPYYDGYHDGQFYLVLLGGFWYTNSYRPNYTFTLSYYNPYD